MTHDVYITGPDRGLLSRLLATSSSAGQGPTPPGLRHKLERALVVEPATIAPYVVTLDSRVVLKDLDTGRSGEYTLVVPGGARPVPNAVSVLAPAGVAILGQQEDDVVEWVAPIGKKRFRIHRVVYQPESAGRLPWSSAPPVGELEPAA